MSDTAISSQIVSEASTTQGGSASSLNQKDEVTKTQASDFDAILDDKLDSADVVSADKQLDSLLFPELDSQELVSLDQLLNNNPLLDSQLKSALGPLYLGNMSGNLLPSQAPSELQLNDLMTKTANPLLAQNMPFDGKLASSISLVNPAALSSNLLATTKLPLDDGILTSQVSALFSDKTLPDLKQLNTQLFGQMLNTAQAGQALPVDNTLLAGTTPGMIVNHSLSLHSSQAVLPAITVSPDSAQWNSQVGDRINWMVNNNMQRVEIRLDPPELGNLDIRLNMAKDNQASILIHVTSATAKEAIESAIPRLREMFQSQGLELTDIDVSQQGFQQQQQSAFEHFNDNSAEQNAFSQHNSTEMEQTDDTILAVTKLSPRSNNLLDTFA